MFQDACRSIEKSLLPIIMAQKLHARAPKVGIAAGMPLNHEGDILTAGHVLQDFVDLHDECEKNARKRRFQKGDALAYLFLVGTAAVTIDEIIINADADIGVLRINKSSNLGNIAPVTFRAGKVEFGEFLCRVGFPFVDGIEIKPRNNEEFEFVNLFPVPLFVNEAMVSRFSQTPHARFIETSSPGLRGQSGGPLVDVSGHVCGMQISTSHHPLEFTGKGRNQVLNVGRAVHVDTILAVLAGQNITHQVEEGING